MTRVATSYDVFDTVVTRSFAHPRDLYVHLGSLLAENGLSRIPALDFAEIRWRTERTAHRREPGGEFLLDDIYRELAAELGWDPAQAQAAKDLELAVESRHLHGIPLIRAELARARTESGRLLFLSDMYLPSAVLGAWLKRERIMEEGDVLYVSGEARANKHNGGLFLKVRDELGINPAHWRHAGDHPVSDCARPRSLGLDTVHLTHGHLTQREHIARGTTGEFAVPWRSLLSGAMRLARLGHAPANEREAVLWTTATNVTGPLFYGFVRWTLAEARRRGLRRLYFLARDGQIFWRIARELEANEPSPIDCRYLQASRLVFSGPSELATPRALRDLAMPNAPFHTLRQALLQLGLDFEWAKPRLPAAFATLDPDTNLALDMRDQLADWLLAPARAADIRAAVERRARQARAYLHSAGVVAGDAIGLVDAGWYGSIHRNLEHILGEPGIPAPLVGFYLGLRPQVPPAPAGELLGYTNCFQPLPLMRDPSHRVLVELMAQSDHGQVAGFAPGENGFTPVLLDQGPVNLAEIRLFQEAILTFTRRMSAIAGLAPAPETDFARTVIGLYRSFHDRPSRREAEIFGFLPHSDQPYEQRHASLCARFGFRDTVAALVNYRLRPPQWWMHGQAALGQGFLLRGFLALKGLKLRLSRRPP
jgi:FMN phosphatase YigB (HAD superfamily)